MGNRAKHTRRRAAIEARAAEAIGRLYHNATPSYPRLDDIEGEAFQSWFEFAVDGEVDYLRSGSAYGGDRASYRRTLEHPANAGKLKSEAARAYYVAHGLRGFDLEHSKPCAAWELIGEFGKLYQYGRGGRTLAPSDLVSRDRVNPSALEGRSIADLTRAILILESFNAYVGAWCEGVPEMWAEYREDERIEAGIARGRAEAAEAYNVTG